MYEDAQLLRAKGRAMLKAPLHAMKSTDGSTKVVPSKWTFGMAGRKLAIAAELEAAAALAAGPSPDEMESLPDEVLEAIGSVIRGLTPLEEDDEVGPGER